MSRMFNPPHPGEALQEYLPEGTSAEMAMRLSKALSTSADLWLGMQMQYDLWQARQHPPKGVQKLAA